jgi:L-seryl-tRNA(Ser) seleniumtransferase
VPYVVDLGAGALVDLADYGLPREPLPQQSLAAGADVVTFSGDKLLGGPQAGLIVGSRAAIARIKKDPLKRALRVSKLTLAALEATLRIYASGHRLRERLPTLALLHARATTCSARRTAARRASRTRSAMLRGAGRRLREPDRLGQPARRAPAVGRAGRAPGRQGARSRDRRRRAPDCAAAVPVIGRIADNALWLDLRCLAERDEAEFCENLQPLGMNPRSSRSMSC